MHRMKVLHVINANEMKTRIPKSLQKLRVSKRGNGEVVCERTAAHTLTHTATHCNTLSRAHSWEGWYVNTLQHTATHATHALQRAVCRSPGCVVGVKIRVSTRGHASLVIQILHRIKRI